PAADWNAEGADGDRRIRISGTSLQTDLCDPDRFTAVNVTVPLAFDDCNSNGLWDACELADGSVIDTDGDGVMDECDGCVDDPLKTEPGACGCGTPDTDTDEDGTPDCNDPCPTWPYECNEGAIVVTVDRSIQEAIDAVAAGGVIELSIGTHTGTGGSVINMSGKPMTIRGQDGEGSAIVDGEDSRRGLYCSDVACNGSVIENIEFRNGMYNEAGAGAYLRDVEFSFLDCMFSSNKATGSGDEGSGGGIYAMWTTLTLANCNFDANDALRWGGGVCIFQGQVDIDGCTFSQNDAESGGGLLTYESTFEIDDSDFTENFASAFGGGFNNAEGGSGSIRNCTFTKNSTHASGGGAYLEDLANTDLVDLCDFTENSAVSGAGIHCQAGSPTISNSTFTQNDSTNGGGVRAVFGSNPMIQDCGFVENSAIIDGGGVQADNSAPIITDCTFDRNSAGSGGGGLSNYPSGDSNVIRCVFTDNTAETGGGAANSNFSSPTYDQCEFIGNIATSQGTPPPAGAIYTNTGSDPTIANTLICSNVQNGTIQVVPGYQDGGGNCISEVCDSDQDGTLDCNDGCPNDPRKTEPGQCGCGNEETDTDEDGIADCNDPCPNWPYDCSEDGQTFYVALGQSIQEAVASIPDGGTVEIAAGTFTPAATIDLLGKAATLQGASDVDGNPTTILDGGGSLRLMACVSGESETTTIESLVFMNGHAIGELDAGDPGLDGGGAVIIRDSSPTFLDCRFIANVADGDYGYGGAILAVDSEPEFRNCEFDSNLATGITGAGGAVKNLRCEVEFTDCLFVNNTSNNGGGAVYNRRTGGSFLRCDFIDNTASGDGGAITNYLDLAPRYEQCLFTGNTAGGGTFANYVVGTVVVQECIVRENICTINGNAGAFYNLTTTIALSDSTVCGNTLPQVVNNGGSVDDLGGNCIAEECGEDLDGNGVPDSCDPDCNENGIPDGLDADCDDDGIPDDCAIDDGLVEDCNLNSIPDACDIADGTELDANDNGVPDTCDLLLGDLNLDGCIDGGDLGLLIAFWGFTNPPIGDLNQDGFINGADLGLLLFYWAPCP
ncbi:MAG: hypothetical protein MK085_10935, partial [Phycisphaerales bacterium]|nr:hypothetical protein [Phycisphaerales bacterium]